MWNHLLKRAFWSFRHWLQTIHHSTVSTEVETARASFGRKEDYLEEWSVPVDLSGVFSLRTLEIRVSLWAGNRFQIHTFLLNGFTKGQIPNHWNLKIRIHALPSSYKQSCHCLLIIVIMAYTQGIAWQALTQCIINCKWRGHNNNRCRENGAAPFHQMTSVMKLLVFI